MNGQDRILIADILSVARKEGEINICLGKVSVQVFRNLYHTAKNLEADLNVEVIKPGHEIRIYKNAS